MPAGGGVVVVAVEHQALDVTGRLERVGDEAGRRVRGQRQELEAVLQHLEHLGVLDALDRLGEAWGEPMERSRPRREDYAFVAPKSAAEDVLSSNRLASVATPRGHQFPFAFLDIASGLKGSNVPFVHLDIGGAAYSPADWQTGTPTAAPVLSLIGYLGAR